MYPVLLELGPLTVYSYGVMMALGFVAAAWILGKGLAYQGRDPDLSSTLVLVGRNWWATRRPAVVHLG